MPSNFVDLEDLEDFFEKGFDVISASVTEWSFAATSDAFAGYSVTLKGAGFSDAGNFPEIGSINGITILGPDGVVTDVTGLNLPVADLLDEIDFDEDDDEEDVDDGDVDDDDDGEVDANDSDDGEELFAGEDDDNLDGSNDDDDIHSGTGDDDVDGNNGDDDLFGDAGADFLRGGRGKDDLFGGDDNDTLAGGNGKDSVSGDGGDDYLSGGNGKDELDGGAGDDTLKGGRGKDTFQFGTDFGHDTITSFRNGEDCINLQASGLEFDDLDIVYSEDGATISTAEGTIYINKVGTLDASDFLF